MSSAAQTDAERALLALRWGQHLAYRRADPVAALERATTLRAPLSADASVALDAEMVKWRLMAGVPLDAAVSPLPRLAPPPGSPDDESADRDVADDAAAAPSSSAVPAAPGA